MGTYLDDFPGSSLDANWSFLAGNSSRLTIAGGDAKPNTDNFDVRMFRSDWSIVDAQFDLPFRTRGGTSGSDSISTLLKRLGSNRSLECYYLFSDHKLHLSPIINPSGFSVYSFGPYTIPANSEAWMRCSIQGNLVTVGLYDSDPDLGGTQRISGSVLLADNTFSEEDGYDPFLDNYATQFGAGVSGNPGLDIDPTTASGWAIHKLAVQDIAAVSRAPVARQLWPRGDVASPVLEKQLSPRFR